MPLCATDIIDTALFVLAQALANTLEAKLGAPRLEIRMMIVAKTMVETAKKGPTTIHLYTVNSILFEWCVLATALKAGPRA
ncbi:MAG: hypothetical protein ACI9HA_003114 [Dinoroseobacter sp.]|jgi:hypothetical protein